MFATILIKIVFLALTPNGTEPFKKITTVLTCDFMPVLQLISRYIDIYKYLHNKYNIIAIN